VEAVQDGQLHSRNYAGYITVDEARGRKLFFWFSESRNNPAADPVRFRVALPQALPHSLVHLPTLASGWLR
jgi:hypothetical protein